jgi:peptidoglycan hydrolase CwlO-like protein
MADDKGMTVDAVDKRLASLELTVANEFFAQNKILKRHGEDLVRIESSVNGLAQAVKGLDAKVNGLDAKVTDLDAKVTGLDAKVTGLDAKVNGLDAKVNGLDAKVNGLATKDDLAQLTSTLREHLAGVVTKADLKSAFAEHQKRFKQFE